MALRRSTAGSCRYGMVHLLLQTPSPFYSFYTSETLDALHHRA